MRLSRERVLIIIMVALSAFFVIDRINLSDDNQPTLQRAQATLQLMMRASRQQASNSLQIDPAHVEKNSEAILSRPLFREDRRPVTRLVAAVEAPRDDRIPMRSVSDDYALVGTVINDDGSFHAFVREPRSSQMHRVTVGDRLGRWEVTQIEANSVVFITAGITDQLTFGNGKGASQSQTPNAGRNPQAAGRLSTSTRPPGAVEPNLK